MKSTAPQPEGDPWVCPTYRYAILTFSSQFRRAPKRRGSGIARRTSSRFWGMSLRRGGVACQASRPTCHRIASSRRLSRSAAITFAVFAVLVGVPSGHLAEGQPLTTFETLDISWSGTFSATYDPVSSTQYPRGVPGI